MDSQTTDAQAEAFLVPCRSLSWRAPFRWLRLGWRDFLGAGRASLAHGLAMVGLSYLVSLAAWDLGTLGLLVGLLSGFVFVGPLLAIALYSLSRRMEQGEPPSYLRSWRDARGKLGNELVFALVLIVVLLVWIRAASMVHVFFPSGGEAEWTAMLPFLAVGSAVGALFSGVIFIASAFSLPMLLDRDTDAVTAIVTSTNAVLRNKLVCAIWAALIVLAVLLGFATAFLGLAVLLPVIGHATWHAYRETIL